MLESLRMRIAVYVLLLAAAFIALGFYVIRQVEGHLRENVESDLASHAQTVANASLPLFEDGAPAPSFDRLAKELAPDVDTRLTIIDAGGVVLGDSQVDPAILASHADRPEFKQAIAAGEGQDQRGSASVGADLKYVARSVTLNGEPVGVVRVARSVSAVDDSLSEIARSLLIGVAVTAAVAVLLGTLMGRMFLRPLNRLGDAAQAIASGNLAARVTPRPRSAIGSVAEAFNRMAANLEGVVGSLSEERNRLMALLQSESDAIVVLDGRGDVALANPAAERLLGRSRQEMAGTSLSWLMPDDRLVRALRSSGEGRRRETCTIERPSGRTLYATIDPIGGGGRWVSLVVLRDITEMRTLEQARRDFIANISHELRTPLASVKAVVETLQGGALEDEATAREFLARADAEVDRLVLIVEELLELSRLESGHTPLRRERVEMARVLADAVERVRSRAEREGLAVTLDIAPGLPAVTGDAERLERVALNLLDNAIKFTPEGGSVGTRAWLENEAVHVEVKDTGVGIVREDLPRVFERFYKAGAGRGNRGTGLGLAIVKHVIEAHGGNVSVESKEGQGSAFRFSIPVADP